MEATDRQMIMPAHPMPRASAYRANRSSAALHQRGAPTGVLSLRGMTPELWIILMYLVVTTIGDLKAAKLSVKIGPVPIFFTDIALLLVLFTSFVRWPARILYWVSAGTGAGAIGRGAWIFCVLAVGYFALSVSEYHLDAVHDLAIFGYSLFFPLTYFAIRGRRDATRLLRYIVYAGVILALLVLFQYAIGGFRGHLALIEGVPDDPYSGGAHSGLGGLILGLTNEDDAAFCVFALAALSAYIILDPHGRWFHSLCAAACFLALATSSSRAGVVGLGLASAATLLCVSSKYRRQYALFIGICSLAIVLAPALPKTTPGVDLVRGLRAAVLSALGGPAVDSNAEFRLTRWRYATKLWLEHPIFGEGFARSIIPAGLVDETEARGEFNVGMPHNTFLFLAVRAGILGLGVVLFCWCGVLKRLFSKFRRSGSADELAAMNILIAMFGFALFVLFFERPVTNAAFWILAAIGARLAENERPEAVW
jgi:O-antigen ligase